MTKFIFRKINGRIVRILSKGVDDIKNIKYLGKSKVKALDQKRGREILAKIDGKIAGNKTFLEHGGFSYSQQSIGNLRKTISKDRTRYLNLKNGLEDNYDLVKKDRELRISAKRGIKYIAGFGAGIGILSKLSFHSKNKNK